MKIYQVNVDYDHNYASCTVDRDACKKIPGNQNLESWEMSMSFDGSSRKKDWWVRKVILAENDDGTVCPVGDYTAPLGTGDMVLKNEAIEKLKDVLENVEILPVECDFGNYSAINPLTVLDCLDYKKSELWTIDHETEDGRPFVIEIQKHCLKKDIVGNHKLFKIYDTRRGMVYANQEFVDEVNKHGITGFNFEFVWEG